MAGAALLGCHSCIATTSAALSQQQGQGTLVTADQCIVAFPSACIKPKKTTKHRKSSVLVSAAKPLLDQCREDIESTSLQAYCKDDILSALERSLLESQWALMYIDQNPNHSHSSSDIVVRSGQLPARQRRLSTRVRTNGIPTMHGSSLQTEECVESESQESRKKAKRKVEPLHDFVTFFLKPTAGCGMFSKAEEQGFTKHMRVCQSLEKARNKLREDLGYDPPYELWAQSVQLSTAELLFFLDAGETARHKMLVSHLRLVVSVAKQYQNLGVDTADLIQEGSKGLLRGLEKFDHRKGYKISTYVHWWIRQGVTRAIADHSRMMRVPAYMHEVIFAIKRAKTQLHLQGKPITVENLSSLLDIPSFRVKKALKVRNKITSMDKKSNSYGLKPEFNGLHEFIPDRNDENQPWDLLYEEQMIDFVRKKLTYLTPKEQKVICWAFGIGTKNGACSSLASVGRKLGVSKERIRQMKFTALRKMRLAGGGNDTF